MRRKMRRRKRKSISGNVQRNCNWTFATSCVGGRGTGTGIGMRKTTMRMRRKMLRWSGWTQSSQNGCCGHGGLASPGLGGWLTCRLFDNSALTAAWLRDQGES